MAELSFVVAEHDTARAMGSGEVDVLGTPRLLAWLEAATLAAIADRLEPGITTVGYRMDLVHLKPSPVGDTVTVRAEVDSDDGRRVAFRVVATGASGETLAQGEVKRSRVEPERFMSAAAG